MKTRAALTACCLSLFAVLGSALVAQADYPDGCLPGDDHLVLTPNRDVRTYSNPDKCVDALGGDDDLTFGSGSNSAWGDGGNDAIDGAGGPDELFGGAGFDTLDGAGDHDFIDGGSGSDSLFDGKNPNGSGDVIRGGDGNDTLYHCTGAGSNSNDDVIDVDVETVLSGSQFC